MITVTENYRRHQNAYEILFFSNIRREFFKNTYDYYWEADATDVNVHLLLAGNIVIPSPSPFDNHMRLLDELIHQLEYPI